MKKRTDRIRLMDRRFHAIVGGIMGRDNANYLVKMRRALECGVDTRHEAFDLCQCGWVKVGDPSVGLAIACERCGNGT